MDIGNVYKRVAMAERIARRVLCGGGKWEPPNENRDTWRREVSKGEYEYSEEKPNEDVGMGDDGLKPPSGQATGKASGYKYHRKLKRVDLENVLSKGHFSILSAGRNPRDPKEKQMEPDDPFFHERHLQLRGELEKRNIPYTETVGHYGGKEPSFMILHDDTDLTEKTEKSVMVHHKDEATMKSLESHLNDIGTMMNQDSVIHGAAGKNRVVFTAGEYKGQECGGEGWQETPDADDYYTDIDLVDKPHTKFNLNIGGCFEKGML